MAGIEFAVAAGIGVIFRRHDVFSWLRDWLKKAHGAQAPPAPSVFSPIRIHSLQIIPRLMSRLLASVSNILRSPGLFSLRNYLSLSSWCWVAFSLLFIAGIVIGAAVSGYDNGNIDDRRPAGALSKAIDELGRQEDIVGIEKAIVSISGLMRDMGEQERRSIDFGTVLDSVGEDSYKGRLVKSLNKGFTGWERFLCSVEGDVNAAAAIMIENLEKFVKAKQGKSGFATEIITKRDIELIPPIDRIDFSGRVIDLTRLSDNERAGLFDFIAKIIPKHMLAPLIRSIMGTMLGGAGTRWQKDLHDSCRAGFKHELIERLKSIYREFIEHFKAAVPVGKTGKTVLNIAYVDRQSLQQSGMFVMTNEMNRTIAEKFLNAVIKDELGAEEAKAAIAKNMVVVQPITPRRVPTVEMVKEYFIREPDKMPKTQNKEIDHSVLEQIYAYCEKHSGEIAIDLDGKPVFDAENHWDFIKYFITKGFFLKVLKNALVDGRIHDQFLRVGNQDELGGALGEGRPGELAWKWLLHSAQSDTGLYRLITDVENMTAEDWEGYWQSDGFRKRILGAGGAVIEGGSTPGYSTGGGIGMLVRNIGGEIIKTIGVAERGNSALGEDKIQTNITNSNTITYSVLAIALSCGLRPSDIERMIQEMDANNGELNHQQEDMLNRRIKFLEQRFVPVRYQVKLRPGNIPVAGQERDIHGILGRAFDCLLVIGETKDTYKQKVKELDDLLTQGKITPDEHRSREERIARDITFVLPLPVAILIPIRSPSSGNIPAGTAPELS